MTAFESLPLPLYRAVVVESRRSGIDDGSEIAYIAVVRSIETASFWLASVHANYSAQELTEIGR